MEAPPELWLSNPVGASFPNAVLNGAEHDERTENAKQEHVVHHNAWQCDQAVGIDCK